MSWMKDLKRRVRLPFEWMGVGLGLLIFPNLTHKGLFRVCDFISRVMYFFDGRGKRRSLANLRLIFSGGDGVPSASYRPTKREEKIIRRSYRNMARTVGHAFWTCRQAAKRVRAVGETDAETRAFLSANHPAITVSAHLGCWEILSQLAFLEGHRMMSVAKPIGTAGMTRLLMRARRSIGQEIVPAEGALKPLMQGLRDGKSLGLLVDQVVKPKQGGVWVRFFGRPHPVSAAPAFFAAKNKLPIIVAWSRPLVGGRFRCECIATISSEEARDVWGTTQRILTLLEGTIRRHPSCWLLNYNCFRRRPTEAELTQLVERESKTR